MRVTKIFLKKNLNWAMAERFTADQVLGFLNEDFDVSGGEDSDFEGNGVYSYLSDAAAAISIEDLNSSVGPDGIVSGDE